MKKCLIIIASILMLPTLGHGVESADEDKIRIALTQTKGRLTRSVAQTPVECYYISASNEVALEFTEDLGNAEIRIQNLLSGETVQVTFKWGYDEDLVIKSLENKCPVFMSAIAKVFSGHAWVIDGYMKRKRVASTGTISERQTLVHCNWGWNGNCNGYFTSGVFKTNEAKISDGFGQTADNKYWHAFNTITYDNPNKREEQNE